MYLVVPDNADELRHWREVAEQCREQNILFVLPQEPVKLCASVRHFLAVNRVMGRKDRNEHAYKVLEGHFTKLRQDLRKEFGQTFGSIGLRTGTEVIRGGPTPEVVSVESWSDLLPGIADSMVTVFSKELRVRCTKFNEWLARREAWTAVEHICEQILKLDDEQTCTDRYLGFNETSLEAAVIDGVLLENGVLRRDTLNDTWDFAPLEELPEAFREATKHIQSAASGEKEFVRLYAKLIEPPYGVPNGVIPLILAVGMRTDVARIAVYRRGAGGQLARVTSKLHEALVDMTKDPARYVTRYTKLSGKQRCVFKALGPEFDVPFTARDERGEAFYEYCGRVRDAMMAWVGAVPEEAVLGPQASDCEKKLFKLLRAAVPPQVSLLADSLLDVIAEDAATREEIGSADAKTQEFPATVQRWRTLCEQVHRRISGVKASVDREIVEVVPAGSKDPRSDLIEVLRTVEALAPACRNPVQAITSQLVDAPPSSDIAVDVTSAVVRKDPAKLTAEDFGVAAGVLKMARLIGKSARVRSVVLVSGKRVELPDVDVPGLPERIRQDIVRWKEEFAVGSKAIAATVVQELLEEASGEPAAVAVAAVGPDGEAVDTPREAGSGQQ